MAPSLKVSAKEQPTEKPPEQPIEAKNFQPVGGVRSTFGFDDQDDPFRRQQQEDQFCPPQVYGAVAPPAGAANATAMSDAELALAMQMSEMDAYQQEMQEQPQQQVIVVEKHLLTDPIWGELQYAADSPPGLLERLCFGFCPCMCVACTPSIRTLPCCKGKVEATLKPRHVCKRFWISFAVPVSIAQIAVFILVLMDSHGLQPLEENHMIGPHPHFLDRAGAKNVAKILYRDEWWRLASPILLHGGVVHLLSNIIVQLRFGLMVEVLWGHCAWLLVYITSGLFANIASSIFLPNHISVGSSGSVCGLLGAEIVFILVTWRQTLPRDITERNLQLSTLFMAVIACAAISFLPLVDFAAHGGGFLIGACMGLALFSERLVDWSCGVRWTCAFIGVALSVGLMAGCLVYLQTEIKPDRGLLDLCIPPNCA